jgi:hypothetical protein
MGSQEHHSFDMRWSSYGMGGLREEEVRVQ